MLCRWTHKISLLLALAAMLACANSWALSIERVTYEHNESTDMLVIETREPITRNRLFSLSDPARIVVDIARVDNKDVPLPTLPEGALAKTLRFGHFDDNTSRFVLELGDTVVSRQLHTFSGGKGKPYRIVVQLSATQGFSRAMEDAGGIERFTPMPSRKPFFSRANKDKPLIVIDAGHGGKDPGATGLRGEPEKNITLQYALTLREALLRTGAYNVAMTRSDDRFIFLHERVRMAREAGGDLFISLHADSAREASARGISVYTVSEEASDEEAATLAQQENEADKIGGIGFAQEHPEVADILIDLASRDTRIKSNRLAEHLVEQFRTSGLTLLKNPSRYAGFRVLKAPDIPSVLIEAGFLSNQQDEALLRDPRHRRQVAQAIVSAVDRYFQEKRGG